MNNALSALEADENFSSGSAGMGRLEERPSADG